MSLVRRLRLDEIVSSLPELGPTAPDGGYSWFVLFGVIFIQVSGISSNIVTIFLDALYKIPRLKEQSMTVPSVLSMYGIVLGHLTKENTLYFDLWSEKVTLTPILFVAFWSLADPWTKTITDLASIPRLVGLIGVALLTTGVIASGYLATGGVGAYLASLSAGAVMGIGASFVIVESETVLRKHFREKLALVLTLKNVATSIGFTLVPALTHFLLVETGLKVGLLLMTIVFVPTALGTLTLRSPTPQRASPYRLLLPIDEDNELGIRLSSDKEESDRRNSGVDNVGYDGNRPDGSPAPLFSEINSIYAYQETDEDVELFISPTVQSVNKWKQEFRVARYFRFWAVAVTWIGIKVGALFFWLMVPFLFLKRASVCFSDNWVLLLVAAGISSFIPSLASYWSTTTTAQYRRIYFGSACWLGSITFLSLTYADEYYWFLICSLLGGISIGGLFAVKDLTRCEVLGNQLAHRSHKLFSTFVGLGVLTFCFVNSETLCLYAAASLQFFGGGYWIVPPVWEIVQARRRREG